MEYMTVRVMQWKQAQTISDTLFRPYVSDFLNLFFVFLDINSVFENLVWSGLLTLRGIDKDWHWSGLRPNVSHQH